VLWSTTCYEAQRAIKHKGATKHKCYVAQYLIWCREISTLYTLDTYSKVL